MTPMKAIRAKCLDCCCGVQKEVRLCPSENCPLRPYRFGHRPKEGSYTPEVAITQKTLDSTAFSERGDEMEALTHEQVTNGTTARNQRARSGGTAGSEQVHALPVDTHQGISLYEVGEPYHCKPGAAADLV